MIDLSGLNAAQYEAVTTTSGPLLVLAGAGSGKTRVLTYRIAYIMEECGVYPWQILAITFTNKAAAEMRDRLAQLVGASSRGMWVSTFHSMCVRILRANAEILGYTNNFTIYDDSDSKALIKDVMFNLEIDTKRFDVKAIRSRISAAKNELTSPQDYEENANDPLSRVTARVYAAYQERLRKANAFDFDDLLYYTYLLLKHHENVLAAYQDRFHYILVDEYQDTNKAQYEITRLLAARDKNIMVVGDDDQSIYSWRGADIRNILEFENDYPEAKVVKLEQNYRSVGNVLEAANAVIAHNTRRKEKRLFTSQDAGELIRVYMASDGRDEGRWIAGEIEKLHREGTSLDDIAILYRTNSQSRALEDMLLRAGVAYRIVGGVKFFERAEIKDIMAYLTLMVNPADDVAAQRVINVPRRGIGKTTIDRIAQDAYDQRISFMDAAAFAVADPSYRAATRTSLGGFVSLLEEARTWEGDLRNIVELLIERTGIIAAYELENTVESRSRIENIKEFLTVVDEFAATHTEDDAMFEAPSVNAGAQDEDAGEGAAGEDTAGEDIRTGELFVADGAQEATEAKEAYEVQETGTLFDMFDMSDEGTAPVEGTGTPEQNEPVRVLRGDSMADFIEWVRLRTDLDTVIDDGKMVTLMTVHAAKGLEFDTVFVAGLEETLFPHQNSMMDPVSLEEERRLAYVAITRAKRLLYLTCASTRQIYGSTTANPVSRFIGEIPSELRKTTGVGSAGFSGTGWEKRGSRRGISGSGTEAGHGGVFGKSSTSYSRGSRAGVSGASGTSRAGGGSVRGSRTSSVSASRSHSSSYSAPTASSFVKDAANMSFDVGDMVDHKMFGRGKVTKIDGDKLFVYFDKLRETKQLLKDYAPIVKL